MSHLFDATTALISPRIHSHNCSIRNNKGKQNKKILILGQILLRTLYIYRLEERFHQDYSTLILSPPFNSRVHSPNHFRNHILQEEYLNEEVGSSLILPRVTLALVSRGASDRKILIYMFLSYPLPHPRPSSILLW